MRDLDIVIGWDSREVQAYRVAKHSVEGNASCRTRIFPVSHGHEFTAERPIEVDARRHLWCPISEAPMATEHAVARFLVPFLPCARMGSPVLFMDGDVVCRGDVADVLDLLDVRYAVQVVKRDQPPGASFKMDGVSQTTYPRKNWSSVCLWNTAHPGHQRLRLEDVQAKPGRWLHAFSWLRDDEIGDLPRAWNHLVGIDPEEERADARLLHYTLGGPWITGWRGGPMDDVWNEHASRLTKELAHGLV